MRSFAGRLEPIAIVVEKGVIQMRTINSNKFLRRRLCQRPTIKRLVASGVATLLATAAGIWAIASRASAQQPAVSAQALLGRERKGVGFPDFGFMVSPAECAAKYSDQPVFRLKTDFPRDMPTDLPTFLTKIDFRKDPLAYILAVRDYAFEGNIPSWDPFKNRVRQWYHIPWLHPTTTGPTHIRQTAGPKDSTG